jgi:hypothetical protein
MRRFLVVYMIGPFGEGSRYRGRYVDGLDYDRARSVVRHQLRAEGLRAFIVYHPICLLPGELDNLR